MNNRAQFLRSNMPPTDQANIAKMLKQQSQHFKLVKEGFSTMNAAMTQLLNNKISPPSPPLIGSIIPEENIRINKLEERINVQDLEIKKLKSDITKILENMITKDQIEYKEVKETIPTNPTSKKIETPAIRGEKNDLNQTMSYAKVTKRRNKPTVILNEEQTEFINNKVEEKRIQNEKTKPPPNINIKEIDINEKNKRV